MNGLSNKIVKNIIPESQNIEEIIEIEEIGEFMEDEEIEEIIEYIYSKYNIRDIWNMGYRNPRHEKGFFLHKELLATAKELKEEVAIDSDMKTKFSIETWAKTYGIFKQ